MRHSVLIAAVAAIAATGCAANPSTGAPGSTAGASVAPGDDCAVLGALARDHFGATRDDPPTRVTLDGDEPGARWMADCDWQMLGVNYVMDEGPTTPPDLLNMPHVSFHKPVFGGAGATVETSLVFGEYDGNPGEGGSGYACQMRSGVAGWAVKTCTKQWER